MFFLALKGDSDMCTFTLCYRLLERKRATTIAVTIVGRVIAVWEAIKKRSHEPILYKNLSKEVKSDNFCYRKVGRAITKWGAIDKSPISLY